MSIYNRSQDFEVTGYPNYSRLKFTLKVTGLGLNGKQQHRQTFSVRYLARAPTPFRNFLKLKSAELLKQEGVFTWFEQCTSTIRVHWCVHGKLARQTTNRLYSTAKVCIRHRFPKTYRLSFPNYFVSVSLILKSRDIWLLFWEALNVG